MPVRGMQFLPQTEITSDNVVESLQLLYDLLGAEKLGRWKQDDRDIVTVCGLDLEVLPPEKESVTEEGEEEEEVAAAEEKIWVHNPKGEGKAIEKYIVPKNCNRITVDNIAQLYNADIKLDMLSIGDEFTISALTYPASAKESDVMMKVDGIDLRVHYYHRTDGDDPYVYHDYGYLIRKVGDASKIRYHRFLSSIFTDDG